MSDPFVWRREDNMRPRPDGFDAERHPEDVDDLGRLGETGGVVPPSPGEQDPGYSGGGGADWERKR